MKTTKISSEGSTSNFAKFCTRENIPLYGITCLEEYAVRCSYCLLSRARTPGSRARPVENKRVPEATHSVGEA